MGRIREAWTQGRTAFGAWIMMSSPASLEVIASAGFDYVCFDCQHGLIGYEDLRDLMLALHGIETSPIVRVPSNDAAWIGKALDVGAEGIIVPLVNSADDARRAAAACRYPPDGDRSFGPARRFQTFEGGTAGANEGVLCFPMVETSEALEAADAICATEGVDGIYVGPFDLALSAGLPAFSPEHDDAVSRIREACDRAGIVAGIHAIDGAMAKGRSVQGFRLVTVIDDSSMLSRSATNELGAARG